MMIMPLAGVLLYKQSYFHWSVAIYNLESYEDVSNMSGWERNATGLKTSILEFHNIW